MLIFCPFLSQSYISLSPSFPVQVKQDHPKRTSRSSTSSTKKSAKKSNRLDLAKRMEILNFIKRGKSVKDTAKRFKVANSAVHVISRDRKKIQKDYASFLKTGDSPRKWYNGKKPKLDLAAKVKVIEYLESGKNGVEAAKKFGVAPSTICVIAQRKSQIRKEYSNCVVSVAIPAQKNEAEQKNHSRGNRREFDLDKMLQIVGFMKTGKTGKEAAKHFNVSVTYIYTLLKRESLVREQYAKFCELGLDTKTMGGLSRSSCLDVAMLQWIKEDKKGNNFIGGKMLREKALELAKDLGIKGFLASRSWLNRFQEKYGIGKRDGMVK